MSIADNKVMTKKCRRIGNNNFFLGPKPVWTDRSGPLKLPTGAQSVPNTG